jgi:DNA-binding LytR/AlgR family response regulator
MIRCLVADDEKLARNTLQNYISRVSEMKLMADCQNAMEVQSFLNDKNHVDLLFLDIQMPGLTGLELVRSLKQPIQVVLTTAYREHAALAYDLHVTDYLVKPFSFERFCEALEKVKRNIEVDQDSIWVKEDRISKRVPVQDILYLEGYGNYTKIHLKDRMILTYTSLANLLSELPSDRFRQIHRSYVVNALHVTTFNSQSITIGGVKLRVGRKFMQRNK